MDNNEILFKNLVVLFKLFKNSPNHLSKYLIKNSAFSEEFMNSVINSKKLNELRPIDKHDYFTNSDINDETFTNIDEMEDYYNNIITDISINKNNELELQLNSKLTHLIECEKYEEASKLRDYMTINNFIIY